MSVIESIRIQQLTAQRSMLQGKLMQNMITCHRMLHSPTFTGRKERQIELPFVLNNIVIQTQLKMIEDELYSLRNKHKLDYFA